MGAQAPRGRGVVAACVAALVVAAPNVARPAPDAAAEPGQAVEVVADPGPPRCVLAAPLDGVVSPGTADYLASAVEAAERRGCGAVLVRLDTPGGLLDATRRLVRVFLDAPVPVIVYVAPGGARAGSAGVFLTLAGHVAAMAPGTNIGAAHPVLGVGGKDPEEAGGEHLARKVENDTAALARAIAQRRRRNVEWAERAVRESVSATAEEALEADVIDLIAPSQAALLEALHGRVVEVRGGRVALSTRGAPVLEHPMTISQRVRTVLGDPNVATLLLGAGVMLIFVELYVPGLMVAGITGLLLALLGAVGLEVLPIDVGALVLLGAALALFVAELYVTSFGLLALAGLVCFVVGAALLIDTDDPEFLVDPSFGVSWAAILPLALLVTASAVALGWKARRENRRRSVTGAEGLIGQEAVVLEPTGPGVVGAVRVNGERWRARADTVLVPGSRARVRSVRGLELELEPGEG